MRQGDEHSSNAIDSVDRLSGDADSRCAGTVPIILETQKIVKLLQVLFMDEVVGMPFVMKGKCVRLRRTRRPGSCHRSSASTRSSVFP